MEDVLIIGGTSGTGWSPSCVSGTGMKPSYLDRRASALRRGEIASLERVSLRLEPLLPCATSDGAELPLT